MNISKNIKPYLIRLLIFPLSLFTQCALSSSSNWLFQCENMSSSETKFFSDFDANININTITIDPTHGDPYEGFAELEFINDVRACNSGWSPTNSPFSYARIQYLGGASTDREAELYTIPQTTNKALRFSIYNPFIDAANGVTKGRVQMVLEAQQRVKNVHAQVKMRLGSGFSELSDFPGSVEWMTISEWFNNNGWGDDADYPFSITLNIQKPSATPANPNMYFRLSGRVMDPVTNEHSTIWTYTNQKFDIPIERWMTLEYTLVEGGAKTGKFSLSVTDENGIKKQIFNVREYTHHPDDPSPDGLKTIQPIKLYTSEEIIDHVTSKPGVNELSILWDDLDISACNEAEHSICAPPYTLLESMPPHAFPSVFLRN